MIDAIGVVVPAADEQEELPGCLAALCAARERVEAAGVAVRIVVVLDGCTDRSAEVVAAAAAVEAVSVTARCVGAARAAGVAHLLRDGHDPARVLLASTDADTLVPDGWLAGLLAATRAGGDLVLGTVYPRPGLHADTEVVWRSRHQLTEDHPHIHAANLAIRADAYLRLGGWAPMRSGEDEDLVRRAVAARLEIVRTARLPVATSARLQGRAPTGFAGYLRDLVPEPDELVS